MWFEDREITVIGHLTEVAVCSILNEGYVDDVIIEFLGSRTGWAKAISSSKNPRKAAMTILGREKNQEAYAKYLASKADPTPVPSHQIPEEIERITDKFRRTVKHKGCELDPTAGPFGGGGDE